MIMLSIFLYVCDFIFRIMLYGWLMLAFLFILLSIYVMLF